MRSGLVLERAQSVQVDTIGQSGTVGGVILADLSHVDEHVSLNWKFREQGTDVPPGAAYFVRPGDCIRVKTGSEFQIDSARYRVEPGFSIEMDQSGHAIVRDLRGTIVNPIK